LNNNIQSVKRTPPSGTTKYVKPSNKRLNTSTSKSKETQEEKRFRDCSILTFNKDHVNILIYLILINFVTLAKCMI